LQAAQRFIRIAECRAQPASGVGWRLGAENTLALGAENALALGAENALALGAENTAICKRQAKMAKSR